MKTRTAWIGCAAAGVAAFTCAALFKTIPGLAPCGPGITNNAILAFQVARTPAEMAALFGSEPCTSALAAAQKTGLILDGLGFIPLYTAFLIFGAAATGARGLAKSAIIAALALAALSDEIEGYISGRIIDALPGSQGQIDALFWAVHCKYALLAVSTIAIGGALTVRRHFLPAKLPGLWIGAWGLIALAGLFVSPPMMTGAFSFGWISLLLVAFACAIRPRLFARTTSAL